MLAKRGQRCRKRNQYAQINIKPFYITNVLLGTIAYTISLQNFTSNDKETVRLNSAGSQEHTDTVIQINRTNPTANVYTYTASDLLHKAIADGIMPNSPSSATKKNIQRHQTLAAGTASSKGEQDYAAISARRNLRARRR